MRSGAEKKKKTKDGRMNGRKEEAGKIGTRVDAEIRKQLCFPAVWDSALNSTWPAVSVCLTLSSPPSTAPKLPHVNTHRRSVYLTARGQIHTWVRKTPSWRLFLVVFELLALGWPLGLRAGAKAGHMALPYHTQSPGLCHSFLTPSSSAPSADKRGAVRGLGGRLTLTCVTRCPLSHSAGG